MANDVVVSSTTNLGAWTNWALNEVSARFDSGLIPFDDYSKKCASDAMSAIYQLVQSTDKADLSQIDTSNLRDVVIRCASLKLSATALPREVYFQLRTKKINGEYVKVVEMGVEGDGNDALLRNFGVGVQEVYPVWLVHEGDDFTYPKRKGLKIEPPEWQPKGLSDKVIRVVYPVKLKGKSAEEYLISERTSVKMNLMAHIRNNLMNETFGFAKNRYDATAEQKKKIETRKSEIYDALRKCETVDDMIECEIAKPYISAAWLDSPESMIIRKMRNNAIRKFPKDMSSIANQSIMQMDEAYKESRDEIEENENAKPFVIDGEMKELIDEDPV